MNIENLVKALSTYFREDEDIVRQILIDNLTLEDLGWLDEPTEEQKEQWSYRFEDELGNEWEFEMDDELQDMSNALDADRDLTDEELREEFVAKLKLLRSSLVDGRDEIGVTTIRGKSVLGAPCSASALAALARHHVDGGHSSSSPPHLALATRSVVATDKNTSNVVMLSEIVPAGPRAASSKLDRLPTKPASINDMSGPAT